MTENVRHITSLSETPWETWLSCSETQLFHINEPEQGILIAESPNVIARAMNAGYKPVSFLIDTDFYSVQVQELTARYPDTPVYLADASVLNSVTGIHLTRGVLCAMQRREMQFASSMISGMHRVVILENIMNPTNLGAIFRSAAALGMDAVLLTSGCTDPLYRRSSRVSMGTVFQIPWAYLPDASDASEAIRMLHNLGFQSAAMALSDDSVPVDDAYIKSAEQLAIVLGTEGEGLSSATIAACDWTVRIPMMHGVDSLNVAAASAVAFWELRKQNDQIRSKNNE